MKLLESVNIGQQELKNRMVMAPMTRSRANIRGVVSESTVLYYAQRASAGLIISEAINISEEATGSPLTPGLYALEQIEAWKKVTKAVHENGGLILRPTLAYRSRGTFPCEKWRTTGSPFRDRYTRATTFYHGGDERL
jgi:2,4-dienoyl-CoA reductase-like NADH-dependent reductase (Old Yellow Enzyme family)